MTDWRRYDFEDKTATAPPSDQMVWIVEEDWVHGVTVGIFDGDTLRILPSGSDDCDVSWWAPMDLPAPPAAGADPPLSGDRTDLVPAPPEQP
jgi:hypothetical protein